MTKAPTERRRREQNTAIQAITDATAEWEAAEGVVKAKRQAMEDAIYHADRVLHLPQYLIVEASPFTSREQVRRVCKTVHRRRFGEQPDVAAHTRRGGALADPADDADDIEHDDDERTADADRTAEHAAAS